MSTSFPQKRVFTAELRMRRNAGMAEPNEAAAPEQTAPLLPASGEGVEDAAWLAQRMQEIIGQGLESLRGDIRQDMKVLLQEQDLAQANRAVKAAVPALPADADAKPGAAPPTPVPRPEGGMSAEEELALLKSEIRMMSETIDRTKREIAAIYHTSKDYKRMDVMRDELGSVVRDTEEATGSILESMEVIDESAQFIKSTGSHPEANEAADNILDQVVKVFESCNFQDLTGQRINKVVNTMKYIEERVHSLVSIWGNTELDDYESEEVIGHDDLEKTLSATSQNQEKVSQEDIDKLFG